MMLIDPHAHMISRTTDDYEAMANAGIVALIEPAFWLGQPRTFVGTYVDYLSTIVGWERFRAGQFGIHREFSAGDLGCMKQDNDHGQILVFCTHPGGHSLKSNWLRTALKLIRREPIK